MRLEQSLVLNRYLHGLLGVRGFSDLKDILSSCKDGVGEDGQSHFFHAHARQKNLLVPEERLQEYDARVMGYDSAQQGTRRSSFAQRLSTHFIALSKHQIRLALF